MSIEDRLKSLLGEQAFHIAMLMGRLDDMQKRLDELEAKTSGNGSKPIKTKGEHDVLNKSDH